MVLKSRMAASLSEALWPAMIRHGGSLWIDGPMIWPLRRCQVLIVCQELNIVIDDKKED